MKVVPLTLKWANTYVDQHHRHHGSVRGHRFSIGVEKEGNMVGVAIVGRPVARQIDQFRIAEVTRLCTTGEPHVCSMLYAAAARACKAMGFEKIITYILASESGVSLKAAGWEPEKETRDEAWGRAERPRTTPQLGKKTRWAKVLQ